MHGLQLGVQLGRRQGGEGEGAVHSGQQSLHQLGVNLASLNGDFEEGEVNSDEFGRQTEGKNDW